MLTKTCHWPFSTKKKNQYACAYTPITLYTTKAWWRGKWKKRENAVGVRKWWDHSWFSNWERLLDLREQSSGVKKQVPFLVKASCLVLEHINCIFFLHFQLSLICLPVYWTVGLPHSMMTGFQQEGASQEGSRSCWFFGTWGLQLVPLILLHIIGQTVAEPRFKSGDIYLRPQLWWEVCWNLDGTFYNCHTP